jgi:methionyl-tRNA synthetase
MNVVSAGRDSSMPEVKHCYITTTLPYVNSDPHIGFAMEIIRADVIARAKRKAGYSVFFNTGTDEHGQKLWDAAEKEGVPVKEYVDRYAEKFKALVPALGLSEDIHFIRTTDAHHEAAAQEFWRRCRDAGYIEKRLYRVKYCVGCELEKTDSELVDGRCPLHPNRDLEVREEENYFFAFSKFQPYLLDLYEKNPNFVIPAERGNEIRSFVSRGLEDFSISRLKEKMPWGVPVPDDADHVMYVWFDALVNYVSTLGWPDGEDFVRYWDGTAIQYCGKDNLRQQSAMWQAMLKAAGLPRTGSVVIDGFITSGGQKMSKSLGNVLDPFAMIGQFDATGLGKDVLRHFLCLEVSSFEDTDVTLERYAAAYAANCANGIGNLASRIMRLSASHCDAPVDPALHDEFTLLRNPDFHKALEGFDIQRAAQVVWHEAGELDRFLQESQPWSVVKTDPEKGKADIMTARERLARIASMLSVFMPETAERILSHVRLNKPFDVPLFPRV